MRRECEPLSLQDAVRDEAAEGLRDLRNLGATDLAMLTGDNPETGKAIASLLPIDAVHAGLLPEQKIAIVRESVENGKKVAMVGDGIVLPPFPSWPSSARPHAQTVPSDFNVRECQPPAARRHIR